VIPVVGEPPGQTGADQRGIDCPKFLRIVFRRSETEGVAAGDRFTGRGDPETQAGAAEKELGGRVRPGPGEGVQPTGVRRDDLETGLRGWFGRFLGVGDFFSGVDGVV
jgi:hypothetical protein